MMIDLTGDEHLESVPELKGNHTPKTTINKFWDGAVKLTYNEMVDLGHDNYLSFEELLGHDINDAKKILLSTYCLEDEWLLSKVKKAEKVFIVSHPNERKNIAVSFTVPNLYQCFCKSSNKII